MNDQDMAELFHLVMEARNRGLDFLRTSIVVRSSSRRMNMMLPGQIAEVWQEITKDGNHIPEEE